MDIPPPPGYCRQAAAGIRRCRSAPPARPQRNPENPIAVVGKFRLPLLALLGALLLFAQHAALTHAVWHAGHPAPAHEAHASTPVESRASHGHHEHHEQGGHDGDHASRLCDLHALLGQLIEGCATAAAMPVPVADTHRHFTPDAPPLAALSPIQPRSRGPPVRL